jgi:glycosyltransferase involved in cell wall biosynthesis
MLSWETLHSIAVGGIACHVSQLAKALAAKGHDVHVFTRIAPGQSDYEYIDGVHYYRCSYKGHKEFVDDVNSMCRAFVHRLFGVEDTTHPFDLIHAHDWLTANAMIWVKKGRGRRGILTIHASEYGRSGNVFHDGRSKRIRDQERAGMHWADQVIAVSGGLKDELTWMYDRPDWHTAVVYNGVDRERFDSAVDVGAVRRKHAIGPRDPVVLFCGRVDYQKGPDLLVEGFVRAKHRWPNAKLMFVGDGGMRHHVEARAHECGVGGDVRFTGCIVGREMPELFKAADVVAVPSRNEPFGIVVLEAWSAGKPVLATHHGGPGEYVEHGVDGLKIYPDPDSIAWGINRAFENFDRLQQMGRHGRQKVERGFTWDAVADETLNVYHEAAPELKRLPLPPTLTNFRARSRVPVANGYKLATVDDQCRKATERVEPAPEPDLLPVSKAHDVLQHWQQVLTRAGCRAQRHDGRLIIQGETRTVFDILARASASSDQDPIHHGNGQQLELTLVPPQIMVEDRGESPTDNPRRVEQAGADELSRTESG